MALSRPTSMGSAPPTGTQTGTNRVPSAVLWLDRHSTAYNRGSCGLGLPLSRLTELTATHHDPSGNHSYLRGPTSQLHPGPGTAPNGRARAEGRSIFNFQKRRWWYYHFRRLNEIWPRKNLAHDRLRVLTQ